MQKIQVMERAVRALGNFSSESVNFASFVYLVVGKERLPQEHEAGAPYRRLAKEGATDVSRDPGEDDDF